MPLQQQRSNAVEASRFACPICRFELPDCKCKANKETKPSSASELTIRVRMNHRSNHRSNYQSNFDYHATEKVRVAIVGTEPLSVRTLLNQAIEKVPASIETKPSSFRIIDRTLVNRVQALIDRTIRSLVTKPLSFDKASIEQSIEQKSSKLSTLQFRKPTIETL